MESQPIPLNEFSLVQLPLYLKSDRALPGIIGDRERFVSACRQGSDIPISLYPENPYMGSVTMHKKPSNKLVLKVTKEKDLFTGSIVGKGSFIAVFSRTS
mgnify:FL=1